jgi:hypothetical protein
MTSFFCADTSKKRACKRTHNYKTGIVIVVLTSSAYSQQVSRLFIFTWSHSSTQHSRYDSSGWGIGRSQRPLPDNTNTVQETDIHAPGGIRTQDASKRSAADLRTEIWVT